MKVQILPDDYFLGKYRFTPSNPYKIDSRTGTLQIYVGSNGSFTFDQIVRNLVIVSVARRDTTIMIDEELVLEQVDREIEQISQRFPSEADFRRELERSQWGSLAAYRADIQDRKRREMLGEALLEVRRDEIKAPTIS